MKIFKKTRKPFLCIHVDLLADKFKGVLFRVLTYKENLGQELLKGARLQMVSKDQPKTK